MMVGQIANNDDAHDIRDLDVSRAQRMLCCMERFKLASAALTVMRPPTTSINTRIRLCSFWFTITVFIMGVTESLNTSPLTSSLTIYIQVDSRRGLC